MHLDREQFEAVLAHAIADGLVPASLRATHLRVYDQFPELEASLLASIVDSKGAPVEGVGGTPLSDRVVANPTWGFPTPQSAADALAVPVGAIGEIGRIERQIEAAAGPLPPPESPGAPWLDYRPLAEPAEPWNGDHFERDSRRMDAAREALPELQLPTLTREAWRAYAELGRDAVADLIEERRHEQVDQLLHYRSTVIAHHKDRLAAQSAAERDANAEEDEAKRREKEHAAELRATRAANPWLSVNGLPPLNA